MRCIYLGEILVWLSHFFDHFNSQQTTIYSVLKDAVLPVTSLIFSSFAFYNSIQDKKVKKANVSINFLTPTEEWLIDRQSTTVPDVYQQYPYRCFSDVVITNNSSLPITLISFQLGDNDEVVFNKYVNFSNKYKVTLVDKSDWAKLKDAMNANEFTSHTIDLSSDGIIELPYTLKPYESVVTFLVFGYHESLLGDGTLHLKTSRGPMEYKIQVEIQKITVISQPPL